jgi:hypothetical protein
VGCIITSDDDSGDTDVTTTGNVTTTGTAETRGDSTDVGSQTGTGSTTTPPGETTETTESPPDTTVTPETTTGGVEVPPFCAAYGDAIAACFPKYEAETYSQLCAEAIGLNYEPYGEECVAAYEEWVVCLTGLPCEELGMEDPPGCADQFGALETACAGR